jgi:DNA-directed RNA polymerase specialized sigma24 family protein
MVGSPRISWPPIDQEYVDEGGQIDLDLYSAARGLWPKAAALAQAILRDESLGQVALLKVCARITAARASARIQIDNLKGYIFQSYRYEILRLLQERRSHEELITKLPEAVQTEPVEDVLKKIMLEEIVARMDRGNRRVFELRVLGHSYEEIAEELGVSSNILRNNFSRQVRKIKAELDTLME